MSKTGCIISHEGIEYLCGLIRDINGLDTNLIDDINIKTNGSWSSVHTKNMIDQSLTDSKEYVDKLIGALNKLSSKKTTVQPTLNNSEFNVIYLYSSSGSAPFDQYLKIGTNDSDAELVSLGSTNIDLTDYLTITDAVATYCKKTDFDALKTEVTNLKTKVGTDTLNTTSQDLSSGVNELKTDLTTHTNDTDIHITSAERTLWNTVSNIASGIGGRNLLIGTSVKKRKDINTPTDFTTFDPYATFNKSTLSDLGYSVGDELTLSFEWEISQNGSLSEVYGYFSLEWIGVNSNGLDGEYLGPIKKSVDTFSSSHKKGKVSLTTKITSNNILGANAVRIRIDNSVVNFKVSKMKLEKGTIATDWTPAPEDEDMSTRRVAFIGSDVADSNGWYKVAEQTCGGYGNTNITFMVTSTFLNYNVGILQLQIRSDNSSISCKTLKWLTRIGFNVNNYVVVIDGMKWTLYAYQPCPRYGRIAFEILSMSSIDNKDMTWALNFADNSTKETTEPVATVTSSDGASVADVETWTYAKLTYTDTTKTDTPGGSASYRIKNGVCFVRCTVGENITGKNVIKVSGMPPIDGSVNVLLDNDGACVGSVWGYNGTELQIHKTNSKVGYASFSYLVLES